MRQKIFGIRLLLTIAALFVSIIVVLLLFMDTPTKNEASIWGEVKVKPVKGSIGKKHLSNYHAIKQEKAEQVASSLRYKVTVEKENPFLSLYREEAKPVAVNKQPFSKKVAKKHQPDQSGFFSVENTDLDQGKEFFEAVFRETQQVQAGKALSILLKEAIPELSLESGTILKGIPSLAGERIRIHITAGIMNNEVYKVELVCFDKEDCLEGLYHDELSRQVAEEVQAGLLAEVLSLEFKGKDVARKAANLARRPSSITIAKGREVFLAIPRGE